MRTNDFGAAPFLSGKAVEACQSLLSYQQGMDSCKKSGKIKNFCESAKRAGTVCETGTFVINYSSRVRNGKWKNIRMNSF